MVELIFLGPVYLVAILYVVAIICLLWSPIGAFACARAARAKGLDGRRHAIAGATYSILLFLPWIYLWCRLRDKPLRSKTVVAGYMLLYLAWLTGPILLMVILSLDDQFYRILLFAMLALLGMSLLLIKYPTLFIKHIDVDAASDHSLGKRLFSPYLAPFVFTYVSLGIFATVWLRPVD